jgi:hypothetical protein
MFVPQLREHLPGLVAALVASVVATIAASAWLMKVLSPRDDGDDPAPEVDPCDAPGAPPAPAEPRR